ncbi:MAG: hypothetical protein ITF98_10420 [Fermentimonas sp.]|nr:hypothetical protein [Fermentimonas sp.]
MNSVNKQIVSQLVPFSALILAVYSVLPYLRPEFTFVSLLNNTTVRWVISTLILLGFFLSKKYFFDKRNEENMLVMWIYLLWNTMCIIRGMFVAELYWDWKGLTGNTLALMMPIAVFSLTNKTLVQSLFVKYIKYAIPLFLIFGIITRTDAFGFYLIPISVLLFFIPILTVRQKILVITITLIVLTSDLGARSNVIKFGVPFGILLIYYFRKALTIKFIEYIRITLFIIPVFFFILGVTGVFNVFNMNDYIKKDVTSMGVDGEGNRVEQNVIVDTRTFLYEEILQSAVNNNYWLLGRTPARGNDSNTFGLLEAELTGRDERLSNEIGLANVFTWTGLVGVVFYFLIFFKASYLAVKKSKNIYIKMIGIYVAFRWLYSWIEDVNNFTLNYFMLMVLLGISFSYSFRNMTDRELIIWVRGIFDVRYLRLQQYLFKKERNEKRKFGSLADLSQQEK